MAGGMVLLIPCLQKLRINPHTSPVWPRPASRPLGGLTFSRNMAPGRCHWTPVWTEGQSRDRYRAGYKVHHGGYL